MADLEIVDTRVLRDRGNEYDVLVDVRNNGEYTVGGRLEFEYSGDVRESASANIEAGRTGTVSATVTGEPGENIAITYGGETLGSVELGEPEERDEEYATVEELDALEEKVDTAVAELRAELDELEERVDEDVPDGGSGDVGGGEDVPSLTRQVLRLFGR